LSEQKDKLGNQKVEGGGHAKSGLDAGQPETGQQLCIANSKLYNEGNTCPVV
jgi:hypothetical protein